MLNTRVFALSVLTDENGVNIVVGGFIALDGHARSDIGEQGKCAAEGQVEGDVAFTDYAYCGQWTAAFCLLCHATY